MNEMGFIKGKRLTVIKNAPLNDPIEYSIMGYNVSLRRMEASMIEVSESSTGTFPESKVFTSDEIIFQNKHKENKTINIAIVGNPNAGKTSIFNSISGSHEHVGNYSGVTVDSKTVITRFRGYNLIITDLPGTYSLSGYSPEEFFARDFILNKKPDIVINILDATNLERNLFLTTQLIDMNVRVVAALNMYDEMVRSQDNFNYPELGRMLGIPFVPTVGSKGKGISRLLFKVIDVFNRNYENVRCVSINYGDEIEQSVKSISDAVGNSFPVNISKRFLCIGLLEGDNGLSNYIESHPKKENILSVVKEEVNRIKQVYDEPADTVIADLRYGFIYGALKETFTPGPVDKRRISGRIDNFATHRIWGYPIFLIFIWCMFAGTFFLGNYPMLWIEQAVSIISTYMGSVIPDGSFKSLLIDGVVNGVGSVIVFLPNILILFFFISMMEDTGYMARAVFIMDKLMHRIGLHGKSFIPLIMGFGCNVPAIMSARMIEDKRGRLVTMLINPFMSCSARLPVYILLIGAVFTEYKGTLLFGIYLTGVLTAILFALLFRKTILKGKDAPFVMELPPYRIPAFRSVIRHMWYKGSQYIKKMGGIIVIASIIIWALGYFPRNVSYSKDYEQEMERVTAAYDTEDYNSATGGSPLKATEYLKEQELIKLEQQKALEHSERSYMGIIGKTVEPVIRPLGFDWRMGVCLISGIAAKEIIVSTMGIIYQPDLSDTENLSLQDKLGSATYMNGEKEGQKVFTPLVTLSFLAFILLYFPCIATITAISKESGSWKWGLFTVFYTTAFAWLVSFLIYQTGKLIIL